MTTKTALAVQEVGQKIYFIRGQRVMLDSDLAELYRVPTKRLNEQVRRNPGRFPEDFMFRLTIDEYDFLRSQFATLEPGRGKHRKYLPLVFNEHGVTMLASVLNSDRAVQVNVAIVRAFVQLRGLLETHRDLAKKLDQLERKYDHQFKVVFDAIRKLMAVGSPVHYKRIRGLNRD